MNRLLWHVIYMIACTTQNNVHPCCGGVQYEEDSGNENEIVVPSKVSSQVARPYSEEDGQASNDRKRTDDRKRLRLSTLDHPGNGPVARGER